MNSLMLKTGLSRDQLSELAKASSTSLSNMMERQSSFDALMSLDFQSLQSIDNLANLIQSGGGGNNNGLQGQGVPKGGIKNQDFRASNSGSASSLAAAVAAAAAAKSSGNNFAGLANARRLASEGRMEDLIRSLSNGNVGPNSGNGSSSDESGSSNANFNTLLQNIQNNLSASGASANCLFGSGNAGASALSLANLLRSDSSTGLTNLRMQDGLAHRNSSVDDFLSLVETGDIPHQDPALLNVPLQSVMQQQAAAQNQGGAQAAATLLAQQQLLAQAANGGNNASSNALVALAGRAGLASNASAHSFLSQLTAASQCYGAAAAFAQQQQAVNALTAAQHLGGSDNLKRKLSPEGNEDQGSAKR